MSENNVLLKSDFGDLKLYKRGKVRDVYDLGDKLLIVSTDRISCFDVVLPCGIPYKGEVLTRISSFWFDFIKDITAHHYLTNEISDYPPELAPYLDRLEGRSMLVKKTRPLAVECVVRGYLSGSAWKEYKISGSICGIQLPKGLQESDKLTPAVFTPSTKEDSGHDMNVSEEYVEKILGEEVTAKIKQVSLDVYKQANEYAGSKGIIIADTKFEFGIYDDKIIIIDEVLTPDSSRFWPKDTYSPGGPQPSFDKQFVRDYLESIHWNKTPPAPVLPGDIIKKTSQKYLDVYERLTGKTINRNNSE